MQGEEIQIASPQGISRRRYFINISQIKNTLASMIEGNKTKSNIAVLDGVRAAAILIVLFYHLFELSHAGSLPWLEGHIGGILASGNSGVTLFLVLSGLLLFLPYTKSLLFDTSWPSFRRFYFRRILRIFPGYYFSLFILITLFAPEYLRPDHFKQLLLFLTFFMDSAHTTYQQLNGPYWTLAVEWQYYMFLPLIALAIRFIVQRGTLKRRVWTLMLLLFCMMIWGIGTRFAGNYIVNHPDKHFGMPAIVLKILVALFYGTGGAPGTVHGKFFEDFAIGMLIAVCYTLLRNSSTQNKWNTILSYLSPWLLIASGVWLALVALWQFRILFPYTTVGIISVLYNWTFINTFHEFALALGYGAFIVSVLFGAPFIKRVFEWSPLRWIGLISYSIYIWHIPILTNFIKAIAPFVSVFRLYSLGFVWILLIIIPFCFVSFILIEKPFMEFSDKLNKRFSNAQYIQLSPLSVFPSEEKATKLN